MTGDAALSSSRQCIFTQQIDNFRQGDDGRTLYLKARRDDVFEVRSTGFCPELETTVALAIQPDAGSSRICSGDWARVIVPSGAGAGPGQVCRVQVIRKLTAEDIAALPERSRP